MPTAEAHVDTERPSRYLVQFCKHAAAMGAAGGHGDTQGTVTFDPWGTCTMHADTNTLALRIDAPDEENLQRIQDVIAKDFDRFGRRDRLTVHWHRPETPDVGPAA